VESKEIYASSNGDRWLLIRDAGHSFVEHVPNPSSGGRSRRLELEAFLGANRNSPQGQRLIEVIASDGGSHLRT